MVDLLSTDRFSNSVSMNHNQWGSAHQNEADLGNIFPTISHYFYRTRRVRDYEQTR